MEKPKYKRIILKLSGEVFRNTEDGDPIDNRILLKICNEVKAVIELGTEVGLVVGGGNIFRGLAGQTKQGIERKTGDFMGMLATAINGLALMDCLEKMDIQVRMQTAIPMDEVAEPFIYRRAMRHLDKGRLVIFVAGTGNPYFSTDTSAALRASEINAQIILKATKVDGIYDKDPHKYKNAKKYERLRYIDALKKRLKVMDATAFSLCMDNHMPILVFNLNIPGSIKRAVMGETIGTLVHQ